MKREMLFSEFRVVNKKEASSLFAQGARIRVRMADTNNWRLLDNAMARTLHDAIIKSGLIPYGFRNTAKLPVFYYVDREPSANLQARAALKAEAEIEKAK